MARWVDRRTCVSLMTWVWSWEPTVEGKTNCQKVSSDLHPKGQHATLHTKTNTLKERAGDESVFLLVPTCPSCVLLLEALQLTGFHLEF